MPKIDADNNSAYDLSAVITKSATGFLSCEALSIDSQSGLSGWALSDDTF